MGWVFLPSGKSVAVSNIKLSLKLGLILEGKKDWVKFLGLCYFRQCELDNLPLIPGLKIVKTRYKIYLVFFLSRISPIIDVIFIII